jgi:hypothetical protein
MLDFRIISLFFSLEELFEKGDFTFLVKQWFGGSLCFLIMGLI